MFQTACNVRWPCTSNDSSFCCPAWSHNMTGKRCCPRGKQGAHLGRGVDLSNKANCVLLPFIGDNPVHRHPGKQRLDCLLLLFWTHSCSPAMQLPPTVAQQKLHHPQANLGRRQVTRTHRSHSEGFHHFIWGNPKGNCCDTVMSEH